MSVDSVGGVAPPIEEEAALVKRAKAGDTSVWSDWHDQCYPLLYRYAYSRLNKHEDAEDVASQVFLEAIKAIGRYRYSGRPILAWFYGIARHLVSRRRREAGKTAPIADVEQLSIHPAPHDEDVILSNILVRTAMERLKPEHRELLTLRFLLDLSAREVAALLGKKEAAIYSLQVRALGALRREIPDDSWHFL